MENRIGIGIQDFSKLREKNRFYIDKTSFIKEWWESGEEVTLITRPRRFGKTLNMSMVEQFFSINYANRGDLFDGLFIWQQEEYGSLQGTYPVISLTFANVKENNYTLTRKKICQLIVDLYVKYSYVKESNPLTNTDRNFFNRILDENYDDADITLAIHKLSDFLCRYYGKKVIILLDEYDTPMQESYVHGFWDQLVPFVRSLFHATFKTNPFMERTLMTGITIVGSQSMFSDFNNLKEITTTSKEYATSFGFTEEEVFRALDENGLGSEKKKVKEWYDGFVFGEYRDIYNPWSIINFLDSKVYQTYWANTSSNALANKLIQEGNHKMKQSMEQLLKGKSIKCGIDERIVYIDLEHNEDAIWSLLASSGYLKILNSNQLEEENTEIALTNLEVKIMFEKMVKNWFAKEKVNYNGFIHAMLTNDLEAMNDYMKRITLQMFSYFDTGKGVLGYEPERFYHGFVLGLLVDLKERYIITSNKESGLGRYDIMLEPIDTQKDDGMIIEFKVLNPRKEKTLEETVETALLQIEDRKYETILIGKGIPKENIRKYGFAFEGKNVLIGSNCSAPKKSLEPLNIFN